MQCAISCRTCVHFVRQFVAGYNMINLFNKYSVNIADFFWIVYLFWFLWNIFCNLFFRFRQFQTDYIPSLQNLPKNLICLLSYNFKNPPKTDLKSNLLNATLERKEGCMKCQLSELNALKIDQNTSDFLKYNFNTNNILTRVV